MRKGDHIVTVLIPASGPDVESFRVPAPDQADLEVEGWTTGSDGLVNVFLIEGDVPLPQAVGELVGVRGKVDVILGIPPGSTAKALMPDTERRVTLFWDRAPTQAFAVTLRFRFC